MLAVNSQRIRGNMTSITVTSVMCQLMSNAQKKYEASAVHKKKPVKRPEQNEEKVKSTFDLLKEMSKTILASSI